MRVGEIEKVSVLTSPQWLGIFIAIAMVASVIPFLCRFVLGFSVSSDLVFGFYALISGVFSDILLRIRFRRVLVITKNPAMPFVILWIVLTCYVMIFEPLE